MAFSFAYVDDHVYYEGKGERIYSFYRNARKFKSYTQEKIRYCMKTNINYFTFKSFHEMYCWLNDNATKETELFVRISRQKPEKCVDILSYYDAVNAALCFGWIDSTLRNIDGNLIQRFSPRRKNSHWTETNIKRCIELDDKGLMREEGRIVCPYFNNK